MCEIDNLKLKIAKIENELRNTRQQLSDYKAALYAVKHEGVSNVRFSIINGVTSKWHDNINRG